MSLPSTHASLLDDLRGVPARGEIWAAFTARYNDVIVRWCVRGGLSWDDAQDLTQDVLLKLFQKLPTHTHVPARGRFRDWLQVVVTNALTDHWRRHPDRAIGGSEFQLRVAAMAAPESVAELSTAIEGRAGTSAAEVVERVRAKLKETTWQAFYQSLMEGRPAAEVAAALGLSVASVYKATYRVKQMLTEEYTHAHTDTGDTVPPLGDAHPVPS